MNLYESYMYEQPIIMDIKSINSHLAELFVQVNGKIIEVKFTNNKPVPKGPDIVTYTSQNSTNGQRYAIDVLFKNDGSIHRIKRIYKNDQIESTSGNPPRMDYIHSSNIIETK